MNILLVDHRDSFTGNLMHDLGARTGVRPVLLESTGSGDLPAMTDFDLVVLGPGPGHPQVPRDAGRSQQVVAQCRTQGVPLFGVCFGMQLMVTACGGQVRQAEEILHGRHPSMHHTGTDLFEDVPDPTPMMRYHSLVVDRDTLPEDFEVVGWSERQEILAVRHRRHPWWAVQFHPESVGSPHGGTVLTNLLRLAAAGRR